MADHSKKDNGALYAAAGWLMMVLAVSLFQVVGLIRGGLCEAGMFATVYAVGYWMGWKRKD